MKAIQGFEDYFIDKLGNVYSTIFNGNSTKKRDKTIIKSLITPSGYLQVGILSNKKYIHRLVAQAYIPNPDNKPQVNHINGIKTDNRVENLEWCTQSENNKHAYNIRLKGVGENHFNSKLKDSDIVLIRDDKRHQHIIAKDYGVSQTLISHIKLRRIWNHI